MSVAASPVPADERAPTGGVSVRVSRVGVVLGRSRVLDGVDLDALPGTWLAVVGPNGAGKSTLLRALAGLMRHEGRVLLDGADVSTLSARQRARLVGYSPQVPLLPDGVLVRDYVLLGRTAYHGLLAGPSRDDRAVAEEAIGNLDLEALAGRRLRTLSGGERQRAVLARALAQQPRLLLLDEPTAALDLGHAQQVLELVDALRRRLGITVISTLHDLALAAQYAQSLVLLAHGRVVAEGPPDRVLTRAALAEHYGARAEIVPGPDGVRVHPLRPPRGEGDP